MRSVITLKPATNSQAMADLKAAMRQSTYLDGAITRESKQVPGLVMERRGRYITFTLGKLTQEYFIHQGQAVLINANLFGDFSPAAAAVVERTLAEYAARLDNAAA